MNAFPAAAPISHSEDEFRYLMPRKLFVGLIVASCCWFTVDGFAVLPVGFLFGFAQIAGNYETTYFASLRTGWKALAAFTLAAVGSFSTIAFQVGISNHGADLGICAPLLRWIIAFTEHR